MGLASEAYRNITHSDRIGKKEIFVIFQFLIDLALLTILESVTASPRK